MNIKETLQKLSFAENLNREEAYDALDLIMSGKCSSEQVAGFLTAMRMKGETIDELTGFVQVMREKSVKVDVDTKGAVDLVGTGGDKSGTFNISTTAAFVTAGAGVPMIKHGNRSASSKCGSADLLEHLGAVIELDHEQVAHVFNEVGMAFMYAPMFHPAMKYVMPPRRELGFRTFFNILGPMCNPAGVNRYMIGAFNKKVAEQMAMILSNLDTEFAYTFNSLDGLDEISTTSEANIFEVQDHMVSTAFTFSPDSLGFDRMQVTDLLGGDSKKNAEIFTNILNDKATPAQRDIVILNATFAIQVSGKVNSLVEAKEMAEESLYSGAAAKMASDFIEATNEV